jgi:hypothetical protein
VERSGGVTAAAVIVFIGSGFTLFYGAFTTFLPLVAPSGALQTPFLRYAVFGVALFELAFAIWGILAGIGLLRLRQWGRISVIIFSVFLLVCTLPAMFVFPFIPMGQGPEVPANADFPASAVLMIKIGIEVIYGLVAGIGAWWLYFFNTRKVKEQFRGASSADSTPADPLARPLSISIIGWLMVVSSCIVPPFLFFRIPLLFLGVLLSGWKGPAVILAWCAVQAVAGTGLLRLRSWGRTLSIAVLLFGFFNSAMTFLRPGALNQAIEAMQTRMGLPMNPQPAITHASLWVGGVAGVLFAAVQLWFVVTRKKAFHSSRAEEATPL